MSTSLPADVFPALLELLPSGVVYYLPVTDATGTVVDFTFAYLNRSAQQLLRLPAHPTVTYTQHFTQANADGLDFHRAAYQQAEPLHRTGYYQADGYDAAFTMQAQRVNDALLVHFTVEAAADQPLFDTARQAQQAQEQLTRNALKTQRDELARLFEQAPVAIAILTGPELRIDLANAAVGDIWGRPPAQVLGRPYFEALPETAGQGFEQILAGVLTSGQPFFVTEAPVRLPRLEEGVPVQAYVNFGFHPLRDAQQQVVSVLALGIEVTEQVRARQRVEQLNQELEVWVQARTQDVEAARAEAERQRGELERVFEQAPAAIAVYRGPNYTIELANPTVARLWGRTQEQLLGKGLFEALPEVAGMGYEQLLDEVMATGTPHVAHAMEAQHDRNGQRETVYWDFVYVPMYAADGKINGAMVVATEVTQQVRARQQVEHLNQELENRVRERTQQLEQQQQLLQQILRQTPAYIATLDGPEHHFTFFNEPYQQLTAGRVQPGLSVAEVMNGAIEPEFIDLLDRVYSTGQPFVGREMPITVAQPGGAPARRYLDFTFQPLTTGQGHVQGILVFGVDMTQQVLARHQRELQQRLVETLFAQAPTAVWVVQGPQYVFELINPLMEQLLGRTREQALGRPYFEVLPELASQGLPALLHQAWQSGESVVIQDLPARLTRHVADELGYFTFVFQPLRDAHGQVARIACVATDVTTQVLARQQVQSLNEELAAINEELRATNEELHTSNTQLLRTNTDLDTFVYTASHDLKAPIANIEGLVHALQRNLPASVAQEPLVARLLDLMQGAVSRFQQTIGHLTNIAQLQRLEALETVNLPELIADVQLDLSPLLEATGAHLTVLVEACEIVHVAPKTLRSVLYNLLSNALKYRAPDRAPQVHLRVHCLSDQVTVQVQDNGLGLSEDQQTRLFGLFRRLHTHVEGSGVGLYTVKRLVENAGGTISVQSQLDVGSIFTVSLPV